MMRSLEVLVGLAALGVTAASRKRLGPDADWVEAFRASTLPAIDPLLEKHFGSGGSAYKLGPGEFVAGVSVSPEEVEHHLWDNGCRRNLLAASKTAGGRQESGSWAYRGMPLPETHQVHVMTFPRDDGGTDIYAHREYSSKLSWLWRDPTVLRKHYHGEYYSPAEGEAFVRDRLLPSLLDDSE